MTTYKLVMPGDMNHYGFLFGGKMLMWVDEVAWIAVSEDYPTLHFVTVGMSEVKFKKSVHPQSVLRFDTLRCAEGRTSVTYHVDVHRRNIDSRNEELVFSTDITFVCVNQAGEKMPIAQAQAGQEIRERNDTEAKPRITSMPVLDSPSPTIPCATENAMIGGRNTRCHCQTERTT